MKSNHYIIFVLFILLSCKADKSKVQDNSREKQQGQALCHWIKNISNSSTHNASLNLSDYFLNMNNRFVYVFSDTLGSISFVNQFVIDSSSFLFKTEKLTFNNSNKKQNTLNRNNLYFIINNQKFSFNKAILMNSAIPKDKYASLSTDESMREVYLAPSTVRIINYQKQIFLIVSLIYLNQMTPIGGYNANILVFQKNTLGWDFIKNIRQKQTYMIDCIFADFNKDMQLDFLFINEKENLLFPKNGIFNDTIKESNEYDEKQLYLVELSYYYLQKNDTTKYLLNESKLLIDNKTGEYYIYN